MLGVCVVVDIVKATEKRAPELKVSSGLLMDCGQQQWDGKVGRALGSLHQE